MSLTWAWEQKVPSIAHMLPLCFIQGFFIALRLVACAQSGHDVSLGSLSLTLPPPKFVSIYLKTFIVFVFKRLLLIGTQAVLVFARDATVFLKSLDEPAEDKVSGICQMFQVASEKLVHWEKEVRGWDLMCSNLLLISAWQYKSFDDILFVGCSLGRQSKFPKNIALPCDPLEMFVHLGFYILV